MKRILLIFLTLSLILFSFSGCQLGLGSSKKTTETPTEAPTQAPTKAPTEAPTKAPATQAPTSVPTMPPSDMDVAWFDDAVFLGDSVTVALEHSASANPALLGKAKFICAQSLSFHNALWDLDQEGAVHPTYEGETILSETAAEVTGAKKIFVLLGVNDLAGSSPDATISYAKELFSRILQHSPDVKVYVQSVTPMLKEKETDKLSNSKISNFNSLLKTLCEEKGFTYIDLYSQLSDNSGGLNPAYCGDPTAQGIHFNGVGCDAWANCLKYAIGDEEILALNPQSDEPDEINFQDSTTPTEITATDAVQPTAIE